VTGKSEVDPRSTSARSAKLITEVLAPSVVIVLLSLAMAWRATEYRIWPALLWASVVATFSAALPMAFIVRGARAGRWDSHHVNDREGRALPLLVCFGSTAVGLTIMWLGNAPQPMIAMAVTMLAVLVATGIITVWWKVSMHAAVSAGGVAMLAALYHPAVLALLAVVALICWSRVAIRHHTAGQVCVGALVGFAVSAAVFVPLH